MSATSVALIQQRYALAMARSHMKTKTTTTTYNAHGNLPLNVLC